MIVKFYVNKVRVLSDDPRLVMWLNQPVIITDNDRRMLRYQLRSSRGVTLVSIGAWSYSGRMMFGVN